jgi:hypothetical protein
MSIGRQSEQQSTMWIAYDQISSVDISKRKQYGTLNEHY